MKQQIERKSAEEKTFTVEESKYCTCVSHVTCECLDTCEDCGKPIDWNSQPTIDEYYKSL